MYPRLLLSILLSAFFCSANAQKGKVPKDYTRFTTDTLQGHYIPKDLEDCFRQLDGFWHDTVKQQVRQQTEQQFSANAHHGIGMWIRNNWQLWGGSRLSKYFNDLGIYHPDDMSGIILTSYHRKLSSKEIKLNEQVKYYQDYWTKSNLAEQEKKMAEYREFNVGDTVLYDYPFGYTSAKQEEYYDDDKCIATGIVTATVDSTMAIQVLLLQGCDARGIIIADHIYVKRYNRKLRESQWKRKEKIQYMKNGQSKWFNYSRWEKPDM